MEMFVIVLGLYIIILNLLLIFSIIMWKREQTKLNKTITRLQIEEIKVRNLVDELDEKHRMISMLQDQLYVERGKNRFSIN